MASRDDPTHTGLLDQKEVIRLYRQLKTSNGIGELDIKHVSGYGTMCENWMTCTTGGKLVITSLTITSLLVMVQAVVIVWELIATGKYVCAYC